MKKNHVIILLFVGAILFLVNGIYNLSQYVILSLMFHTPFIFKFLLKPLISLIIGIILLVCGIKSKQKSKINLKDTVLKNKQTIIATISMLFGAALVFVGIIFGSSGMNAISISFVLVGGIIAGFSSMFM